MNNMNPAQQYGHISPITYTVVYRYHSKHTPVDFNAAGGHIWNAK